MFPLSCLLITLAIGGFAWRHWLGKKCAENHWSMCFPDRGGRKCEASTKRTVQWFKKGGSLQCQCGRNLAIQSGLPYQAHLTTWLCPSGVVLGVILLGVSFVPPSLPPVPPGFVRLNEEKNTETFLYIAGDEVQHEEFLKFWKAENREDAKSIEVKAPSTKAKWSKGTKTNLQDPHPPESWAYGISQGGKVDAGGVQYQDAEDYCAWKTHEAAKRQENWRWKITYRLPTEQEWRDAEEKFRKDPASAPLHESFLGGVREWVKRPAAEDAPVAMGGSYTAPSAEPPFSASEEEKIRRSNCGFRVLLEIRRD